MLFSSAVMILLLSVQSHVFLAGTKELWGLIFKNILYAFLKNSDLF